MNIDKIKLDPSSLAVMSVVVFLGMMIVLAFAINNGKKSKQHLLRQEKIKTIEEQTLEMQSEAFKQFTPEYYKNRNELAYSAWIKITGQSEVTFDEWNALRSTGYFYSKRNHE